MSSSDVIQTSGSRSTPLVVVNAGSKKEHFKAFSAKIGSKSLRVRHLKYISKERRREQRQEDAGVRLLLALYRQQSLILLAHKARRVRRHTRMLSQISNWFARCMTLMVPSEAMTKRQLASSESAPSKPHLNWEPPSKGTRRPRLAKIRTRIVVNLPRFVRPQQHSWRPPNVRRSCLNVSKLLKICTWKSKIKRELTSISRAKSNNMTSWSVNFKMNP